MPVVGVVIRYGSFKSTCKPVVGVVIRYGSFKSTRKPVVRKNLVQATNWNRASRPLV